MMLNSKDQSIRHFGKLLSLGGILLVSGFASATTNYQSKLDVTLTVEDTITPGMDSFSYTATSGGDSGRSTHNGYDNGFTDASQLSNGVRDYSLSQGSTSAPGGTSEHSAYTSGQVNLNNATGPRNPLFPNPTPITVNLKISWTVYLYASCTDLGEYALATGSVGIFGVYQVDIPDQFERGPGVKVFSKSGEDDFSVIVPGNTVRSLALHASALGSSATPFATPEPSSLAALGLGALVLVRRKRASKSR